MYKFLEMNFLREKAKTIQWRSANIIFKILSFTRLLYFSPAEKRHSRVKSWTKNVDLFSKDFIIVPINEQ